MPRRYSVGNEFFLRRSNWSFRIERFNVRIATRISSLLLTISSIIRRKATPTSLSAAWIVGARVALPITAAAQAAAVADSAVEAAVEAVDSAAAVARPTPSPAQSAARKTRFLSGPPAHAPCTATTASGQARPETKFGIRRNDAVRQ